MNWTDQDVDNLLASVEETLQKADGLAKSAALKKADEDKDPAADKSAAPAQDAPPAAASADAGAADASAAPAPAAATAGAEAAPADAQAGAAGAPAAGDQALESDADAPLSDEELSQIYSSMAPDELERHYSIIRQALQASMSQDQGQAAAPAPGAPPEAAGAAPAAAPGAPPEMEKSEKIAALEKQVGEQAQAIEQITKAFEVLTKPSRKSITEIQVMQKSEADAPGAGNAGQPMTAEQTKEAARKLNPAKLEKSERDMVNKFYLEGVGQKEVEKIIHSKGGK